MKFQEVCYAVVSYAPYILLQIYTIINFATFRVIKDFLLCEEFLEGDIKVHRERHLIFALPEQLRILKQTRRWFIDGTIKVKLQFCNQLQLVLGRIQDYLTGGSNLEKGGGVDFLIIS